MVADAELSNARDAGAQFKPAIQAAYCSREKDEITLEIPWGRLVVKRLDIPVLRTIEPSQLAELYVSDTGIHIDQIDFDVSSAGLLGEVFQVIIQSLSASF